MIDIEMNTRVVATNDRGGRFEGVVRGFTVARDVIVMVDRVDIGDGWERIPDEIMTFPRVQVVVGNDG